MGHQAIVHGRIQLKGDYKSARDYIKSLNRDDKYPWIRTEMFSLGSLEEPYFYYKPIIAFAADYKEIEYDWASFIIKFEDILRHIKFDTAKIELETEVIGTYNFFWKSKIENKVEYEKEAHFIETKDWFFGYGFRSMWGYLNEKLEKKHVFNLDFEYPIRFNKKTLEEFIKATIDLPTNEKIYLNNKIGNLDKLHMILTYCFTHKMIDFGVEGGKGYWVKKLNDIKIKTGQYVI